MDLLLLCTICASHLCQGHVNDGAGAVQSRSA